MDYVTYGETVIENAHARTMRDELQWSTRNDWISADLTSSIHIIVRFIDRGPDSAVWDHVLVTHPVGKQTTTIFNPDSERSSSLSSTFRASGVTLERLNEIFRKVLLEPRQKQFELAMRELAKPLESATSMLPEHG